MICRLLAEIVSSNYQCSGYGSMDSSTSGGAQPRAEAVFGAIAMISVMDVSSVVNRQPLN
jgi:hypothetical protein